MIPLAYSSIQTHHGDVFYLDQATNEDNERAIRSLAAFEFSILERWNNLPLVAPLIFVTSLNGGGTENVPAVWDSARDGVIDFNES